MAIVFTSLSGCKKEAPSAAEPQTLADPIPFDALGSGRILFQRADDSNLGIRFYVIDVRQRRSWGIDPGNAVSPAISPNGQQIAFAKYTNIQTAFDVFVTNADGSYEKNISNAAGQDRFPSWHPNGLAVLFWVGPSSSLRFFPLYLQSTSLSTVENTTPVFMFDPISSDTITHPPSGRAVASSSEDILYANEAGLCTMNAKGGKRQLLLGRTAGRDFESPCFSPDGKTIAYCSVPISATAGENWAFEIRTIEKDGTNPKLLLAVNATGGLWYNNDQKHPISICWSPDGSKLLFNRPDGANESHLYVVGNDGTGLTQVSSMTGAKDEYASWSN